MRKKPQHSFEYEVLIEVLSDVNFFLNARDVSTESTNSMFEGEIRDRMRLVLIFLI